MCHDKLPDVVLYDVNRNWLFLVEADTYHGPVSPTCIVGFQKMLVRTLPSSESTCGILIGRRRFGCAMRPTT